MPAQKFFPRLRTGELSGGRTRQGVRRNDLNETVQPEALADQPLHAMDKFSLPGRAPLTPLDDHDRHFNPIRAQYRKRARLARSYLGQFLSQMLQILSPDFPAINNDDVFLSANDHNPTFGEIANVLGVKPSVRG